MAVFPQGYPRRGEIYRVRLNPAQGSEQAGERRPAVILSNDDQNELAETVTLAPTTGRPARKKWLHEVHVPAVGGLTEPSRIKIDQVRTVSKGRLVEYMGVLPEEYVTMCEQALRFHFALPDG